jgi:hypothetical protein
MSRIPTLPVFNGSVKMLELSENIMQNNGEEQSIEFSEVISTRGTYFTIYYVNPLNHEDIDTQVVRYIGKQSVRNKFNGLYEIVHLFECLNPRTYYGITQDFINQHEWSYAIEPYNDRVIEPIPRVRRHPKRPRMQFGQTLLKRDLKKITMC